jgi:hypothetical protein
VVATSAPWSSSPPSELRITSVFSCVGRGFNARASSRFSGCWYRSLAVDGASDLLFLVAGAVPSLKTLRTGVSRHRGQCDLLALSADGQRAYSAVSEKVHATRRLMLTGLSREQYLATVDVLRQMASNLESALKA